MIEHRQHIASFWKLFKSGGVGRYHTERLPYEQTIADHSWGMTIFVLRFHLDPGVPLLRRIAVHDSPEQIVGDNPAPAKRRWPDLGEALRFAEAEAELELGIEPEDLSPEDQQWVKLADAMECAIFSYQRYQELHYPVSLNMAFRAIQYAEDLPSPSNQRPELPIFRRDLTRRIEASVRKHRSY